MADLRVGEAAPQTRALPGLRLPRLLLPAAALWAGFAWFFTRPARLFDADSYLHLALARTLATHGLVDQLSWARFSVLGEHYGDKELLFHVLLVPFVLLTDPELGGKLALALLCAALALSLGELARRALGRVGWLVPIFVFGSGSFALRTLRLRPELLALLVLLWVVWALGEHRYRLAAALSCAFALSHTAFHSLLGLSVLCFGWTRWVERRWDWPLLAAPAVGCTAGVLLHPQFPNNLRVFWVQNVELFRHRAELDVGEEFQPHTTLDLAQLDAWFWLALLVLVVARTPRASDSERLRRTAAFALIAALAFGGLFAQMGRFATLFIPFSALAVCYGLAARGLGVGARLALPAGRNAASGAVLAVLAAMSCANLGLTAFINWRLAGSFDPSARRELEVLAQHVPPGARVAANWNDAELYAFHAPHARYLNVFDPVFMATRDPDRYAVLRDVLSGALPDIPGAVRGALDSEYLAISSGHQALL
ncbi:MAG TPA: hypothetical protein VJR89_06710, partial [Polyangiales bacterium]|nr:hypothetical protein [Polyangiales bacterium]